MRIVSRILKTKLPLLMLAFSFFAGLSNVSAEVPVAVQAERLHELAERQYEDGDAGAALATLDKTLELLEEHWIEVPAALWFTRAQASLEAGLASQAVDAATRYLREADLQEVGKKGKHYTAALEMLTDVELQGLLFKELAAQMIAISGGSFRMGELSGVGDTNARPVHHVTVPTFKLGKYEVTFALWDVCVADGGCNGYSPDQWRLVWGRGQRPVINVSWDDAQAFIAWLNVKTRGNFRLPTEAEWEFAARAGSATKYSWGNDIGENRANCSACGSLWDDWDTAPVGSFPANAWGLHDMHGNVWEWVQGCWNDSYAGAPSDGSAWTHGDCGLRVVRGGSWSSETWELRSAIRFKAVRSERYVNFGFRLAQDL